MKGILLIILFISPAIIHSQDSLLDFNKIILLDSISQNDIYDKTLIWCAKSFTDSKSAIKVQQKESGIIAGKAHYYNQYRVPQKKDSVYNPVFNEYYFDWLIEIKNGKLKYSISDITLKEMGKEIVVTAHSNAPFGVWFQPSKKTNLEWSISKQAFIKNINALFGSLYQFIYKKSDW